MKMERPQAQPLSSEQLQDLEALRTWIERAIADGYVTADEMATIKARISADGKVLFEEIELCQKLVWDKVQTGELEYRWSARPT